MIRHEGRFGATQTKRKQTKLGVRLAKENPVKPFFTFFVRLSDAMQTSSSLPTESACWAGGEKTNADCVRSEDSVAGIK